MLVERIPEFEFFRGSTPNLELVLPVELTGSDVLYATFAQGDSRIIEYRINGSADADLTPPTGSMSVDPQKANTVHINMSQADTLRFEHGEAALQLRMKRDSNADTFYPLYGMVGDIIKGGTI